MNFFDLYILINEREKKNYQNTELWFKKKSTIQSFAQQRKNRSSNIVSDTAS